MPPFLQRPGSLRTGSLQIIPPASSFQLVEQFQLQRTQGPLVQQIRPPRPGPGQRLLQAPACHLGVVAAAQHRPARSGPARSRAACSADSPAGRRRRNPPAPNPRAPGRRESVVSPNPAAPWPATRRRTARSRRWRLPPGGDGRKPARRCLRTARQQHQTGFDTNSITRAWSSRRPWGDRWISRGLSTPSRRRAAFAAVSARSSGSASITMPGPPPKGRSSTVR
jgi:hypothetical protein